MLFPIEIKIQLFLRKGLFKVSVLKFFLKESMAWLALKQYVYVFS